MTTRKRPSLSGFREAAQPEPAAPPAPAPAAPKPANERVVVTIRMTKRQRRRVDDLAKDNDEAGSGPTSQQAVCEAALNLYFDSLGLPPLFERE